MDNNLRDIEKLKPCPFCGGDAEIRMNTFGDSEVGYYRAVCFGKEAHCLDHWSDTREEAIEIWNRRVEDGQ